MKGFLQKKHLWLAVALALSAGSAFSAESSAQGGKSNRKITDPTSTLEGYFVRVKSAVSGEKELYYNKDGSLRTDLGSGLLEGDFSLDESLLGGDDALDFSFESAGEGVPEKNKETNPAPAVKKAKPESSRVPAPIAPAAKPAKEKKVEPDGTVDEHSILKKYSKEKRDFGLAENFQKTLEMTADSRFDKSFSMREWQNSTSFGMRRFSRLDDDPVEMRGAFLPDGENVPGGLFSSSAEVAGNRMFVRRDDGLVPVNLNERFSNQDVRPNERSRLMRETSGLSMQDINRYQFRRNRSTEAGLPVVSPGKQEVRSETFTGSKKSAATEK